VRAVGEGEAVWCEVCYTCQVCVSCEKYAGARGAAPPQAPQQQPRPATPTTAPVSAPAQAPAPAQLLTEDELRRIIKEAFLEVLIQLGLVKPPERQRELK
jgi:hypothetical protein